MSSSSSSTQEKTIRLRRLFASFERTHVLAALVMYTLNSVMICNGREPGDPPPYKANDISCYYDISDSLPEINDDLLNRTSRNIFFIETSCQGYLSLRQACAVESAARAHPYWQINLLFVGPVTYDTLNSSILSSLKSYNNVVLARVNFLKIVKDTPLQKILTENLLEESEYRYAHASDIIRVLLMWRFCGVYMDLDVVVLKPINDRTLDFAGLEGATVRTGVLGLSHRHIGRKLAADAVSLCAEMYNPSSFHSCGSKLWTQILRCQIKSITTSTTCGDFKVYSEKAFYPISEQHWQEYFKPVVFSKVASRFRNSYTAHIYNSLSHNIKVHPGTLYGNMAKRFCPSIYRLIYNSEVMYNC